jgi:signal transduction histidine kinase
MVRGHDPALRRLLLVLLENARAHTERGWIEVLVADEPDSFVLEVRDTGEGIPAEALDRVFDRFFRVDAARSRAEGRLGVGLSIAKRIAELHGAEIVVTSRVGVGSEFRVRFPRNGR